MVSRDHGQDWLAVAQAIANEGTNVFPVLLAAGVEQRQMDQAMVTWHGADRLIHNPTDASAIVRGTSRLPLPWLLATMRCLIDSSPNLHG
jgi:hypothetical protein